VGVTGIGRFMTNGPEFAVAQPANPGQPRIFSTFYPWAAATR
jgi:hypothetical protein